MVDAIKKAGGAGAAVAVYFAAAISLKYSYVPLPGSPERIWLKGPIVRFGSSGAAYVAAAPLGDLADSNEDGRRSPLALIATSAV
jgi:hypothetical protein